MTKHADIQYLNLLADIMNEGELVQGRNAKTMRLPGLTMKFDSTPLISLRRTAWKLALREMEWFLSGSSNINHLHPSVRHWWSPWAQKDGDVPNNYGHQFRSFSMYDRYDGVSFFDQVEHSVNLLRKDPGSRRNVMTVWNPGEMASPETPITNCHSTVIQLMVREGKFLDMIMYQRSADMVLGVPHNLIQHWAFLLYLARRGGKIPGTFQWVGGDCHIYEQHFDGVEVMVRTNFKESFTTAELMYIPTSSSFFASDFSLYGEYSPLLDIKFDMIV